MHPLSRKPFYSNAEWALMQRAHAKASRALQRSPLTDENALRLARRVMTLVDRGLCDEEVIVSAAVHQEMLLAGIVARRHNAGAI